jgi:hypothetical protein
VEWAPYARWIHGVLLVHVRLALVRFPALPVAAVDARMAPASDVKLKGSNYVVSASLRLDDGSVVEIAGLRSAAEMLLGPFANVSQITTDGRST